MSDEIDKEWLKGLEDLDSYDNRAINPQPTQLANLMEEAFAHVLDGLLYYASIAMLLKRQYPEEYNIRRAELMAEIDKAVGSDQYKQQLKSTFFAMFEWQ
jgi:hypothetical protein